MSARPVVFPAPALVEPSPAALPSGAPPVAEIRAPAAGRPAPGARPAGTLPPEVRTTLRVLLDDPTGAGEARRLAVALAEQLGFDEAGAGRVALVVTEAASNVVKHAGHGELLLRAAPAAGGALALQCLALDRGRGIADVGRALTDGYSTAGTSGAGLGAIARLADRFELQATPDRGTVLLAELRPATDRSAAAPPEPATPGAVCVPKPGQAVCGDAWDAWPRDAGAPERLLVVDGLGHGPDAAAASAEAVRLFRDALAADPAWPADELLRALHRGLRATRGAAVALVDVDAREVRLTGVGNVAGVIVGRDDAGRVATRSMVSHNGIVGHEMRKVQTFAYPAAPDDLVVLHTDGLASRWTPGAHPGLLARSPALVAGVLYRDAVRGTDDATVVVTRVPPAGRAAGARA